MSMWISSISGTNQQLTSSNHHNDSQRLRSILVSVQFMTALKIVHTTYKIANPSNTYFAICSIPQNSFFIFPSCWRDSGEEYNRKARRKSRHTGPFKAKKCSFSSICAYYNTSFVAFDS